jgi:Golgi phosphoprotein 3
VDLILAEQTLLIALDDEKGRDTTQWGSDAGLAGALLLDLARLELISADADGKIVAVDDAQPGHELIGDAYTTIRESSKRRNARGWVQRLPRELKPLRQRLARELVQRGILSEEHSKAARHPPRDPLPHHRPDSRTRTARTAPRHPRHRP